jgi:3-hydroxybutyryl-CoA dehydrogenase
VKELITSFGKLPVVLRKDVPGFVANRFLMPMLIEEARLLEERVPSKEEIDLLVKNGLGSPSVPSSSGTSSGSMRV